MPLDKNIDIAWGHRIEVADHHVSRKGARSKIAWWLRSMADKLDGGRSLRIKCHSTPQLPASDVSACIEQGFHHANRMLTNLAHQEACEQALKEKYTELFD